MLHLEWHIHAQKKIGIAAWNWAATWWSGNQPTLAGWINQANALFYLMRTRCVSIAGTGGWHFPENEAIPYNLACYACQFGDLELAIDWYRVAEKVGEPEKIREVALMDPDMELLWEQIRD